MQKLIIDKVTGTVLNIEGCYLIDADQLDDSFTDSEVADLADSVGVRITDIIMLGQRKGYNNDNIRTHQQTVVHYAQRTRLRLGGHTDMCTTE